MAHRSLIVGKAKDGTYRYGQINKDAQGCLKLLRKYWKTVTKVNELLYHLTEGGDNGRGRGICCLCYDGEIEWYEDSYCCGIAKTKDEMLDILTPPQHLKDDDGNLLDYPFDFPEYLFYWNGKKWSSVGFDTLKSKGEDGWVNNWKQFAPLVANN